MRPTDIRGLVALKQKLYHKNVTLREKINDMEYEFKTFKEFILKNLSLMCK